MDWIFVVLFKNFHNHTWEILLNFPSMVIQLKKKMIPRDLANLILPATPPKAVVIYGPRRAGKTTLVKSLLGPEAGKVRLLNADRAADVRILQGLESGGDIDVFLNSADTIVIDEAQRVPNIGLITKILVDANQRTKLFLTGSSSFDLARGVRESAVGRLVNRQLWPFSASELAREFGWGYVQDHLEQFLVYGMFPDNVLNPDDAVEMLMDFVGDLMYKDAFALTQVRSPMNLHSLVYLLAQNVGQEVSYDNLARETKLSSPTIERYLDILEKCFIIRRVPSFARNLGNELKKGKKIYFCDVGIRNAILNDFTPFSARADAGAIWENFFFMERLKKHDLERTFTRQFFWRIRGTRQVAGKEKAVEYSREIDFIEAKDNKLEAFECKLNPHKKDSGGKDFREAYPNCPIHVVSPSNCLPFFETISP